MAQSSMTVVNLLVIFLFFQLFVISSSSNGKVCTQTLDISRETNMSFRAGCAGMTPMVEPKEGHLYFSSNHKTGTVLSGCLRKQIAAGMGVRTECLSRHMSGGFNPHSYQINFVRNPFLLVHSGYRYHQKTNEIWTKQPFDTMNDKDLTAGIWQGVQSAFITWSNWCNNSKTNIHSSNSYHSVLNSLPSKEAMLFESIRSLYRDIPYVVSSARNCFLINQAVDGSCRNILLDDFVANFNDRIISEIATTFRLSTHDNYSASALIKLTSHCDINNKKGRNGKDRDGNEEQNHITSLGRNDIDRIHDINVLRGLDNLFLRGALSKAEEEIQRYMPLPR
jgi:hypothetical protein